MLLIAGSGGKYANGGSTYVGLLDNHPSTEPAGSLRRLRGGYTGYCLQVRRASDGVTADVGFITGQVDRAAIATHCGSSNGYISILYDQNTAVNFVPSATGKQPQIYDGASGLVLENEHGNPAWHMLETSEFTMSGFVYTSALSVIMSMQKTLVDTAGVLLWSGNDTQYSMVYQAGSGSGLSQNAGSPTAYINSVLLSPQNRNALHDALDSGVLDTSILGIRSTEMAGWSASKIFGYYSRGTSFAPDSRCSDLVLWKDSEITLGDFNAAASELLALVEA